MSEFIEWGALGQVVVAGILVGAGLPALFALGLRLLNPVTPVLQRVDDGPAPAPVETRTSRARRLGAMACFTVVLAAVVTGLGFIVAGGH